MIQNDAVEEVIELIKGYIKNSSVIGIIDNRETALSFFNHLVGENPEICVSKISIESFNKYYLASHIRAHGKNSAKQLQDLIRSDSEDIR